MSSAQARMAARSLLHAVMLVMRTMAAEMRRSDEAIAPPQMGMLMKIGAGPTTMSDLARSLAVTLPTVSKSVELLVHRRWVARWVDTQDRRQTIVRLTPKGRRILADIRERAEQHIAERLAPLQAKERAELIAIMTVLARVLTVSPVDEVCLPPHAKRRPPGAQRKEPRHPRTKGEPMATKAREPCGSRLTSSAGWRC